MTLAIRQQQVSANNAIETIDDKARWCEMMAGGDMLPRQYRNKPANLLFAIEYADALGIPRVNALTSIHVIEGKPSASADLMASMVRKAGHKLRVKVEGTGKQATAIAQVIRADDPDFTYEVRWTWQDALNAGLENKDNWRKYPTSMMKARAISAVIREGASDAMMGVIYTPEELGAVVDQDGNPVKAMTSNHAVAARATTPHPEEVKHTAPPVAARPAADIAADVLAPDATVDTIKDLWRESRDAGHHDLKASIVALMNEKVTEADFRAAWLPETVEDAPQDAEQPHDNTDPVEATLEALDGEIVDNADLFDTTG